MATCMKKQFFSENIESMLLENAPLYLVPVRAWQAAESNSAGSRDSWIFFSEVQTLREARSLWGPWRASEGDKGTQEWERCCRGRENRS